MVGARLAALLLLTAVPAAAQSIRGQLTDSISRAPLAGAFLTLIDDRGVEKARTITNAAGEFLLAAPAAGTYRLRSKRIGFRPYVSRPLELHAGETISYNASIDPIPVALAKVVVAGDRQCDVEGGASVAAVWEEVHEALAAVAWTSRLPSYWYDITHFKRQVTLGGWPRGTDSTWREIGYQRIPIKSAPPEQLDAAGYIVADTGNTWVYFGPDADVLISAPFVRTHCFETKTGRGETAGLIGLAFTPARGRTLADITGALWIDRESAELRFIEYSYTRLPEGLSAPRAGGHIEFLRLPSGTWIVRDWVIRMPRAALVQRPLAMGSQAQVTGYLETGGNMVEIKTRTGTVVYRSDSAAAAAATVALAQPTSPADVEPKTPAPPAPPAPPDAAPPVDSTPSRSGPSRNRGARNATVLKAEEFEGSSAIDAMALVQEFRPTWLHTRGVISIRDESAGQIRVYLNGVSAGDVNRLREIRVDDVREIRFLGAAEAQSRYGVGHAGGVIEVWTK